MMIKQIAYMDMGLCFLMGIFVGFVILMALLLVTEQHPEIWEEEEENDADEEADANDL